MLTRTPTSTSMPQLAQQALTLAWTLMMTRYSDVPESYKTRTQRLAARAIARYHRRRIGQYADHLRLN